MTDRFFTLDFLQAGSAAVDCHSRSYWDGETDAKDLASTGMGSGRELSIVLMRWSEKKPMDVPPCRLSLEW